MTDTRVNVGKLYHDFQEVQKKVETLQEENTNLRKQCEMLESLVMQVQKDAIESKQVHEQQLYSQKQKILEEIDERIADATKKEVGPLERIRLYFVNKKARHEAMKQLL